MILYISFLILMFGVWIQGIVLGAAMERKQVMNVLLSRDKTARVKDLYPPKD